eukprot:TRINITY_DN40007_c0_g1_i1.p1 TRINITY_DN40007_c0_g1~~TRINITY_DN40007_c0_g1_i1.p1  ORF type:complete len:358 (+),score=57.74 TRINITY_DN40007_c0_g1_i1:46-1119(+)
MGSLACLGFAVHSAVNPAPASACKVLSGNVWASSSSPSSSICSFSSNSRMPLPALALPGSQRTDASLTAYCLFATLALCLSARDSRRGSSRVRCSRSLRLSQLHAKKKDKGNYKPKARPQSKQEVVPVPHFDADEVFSLDVECVATGRTHLKSDREPCSLALVDGRGKVVMQTLIQPSRPVVSYLTQFTGLREGSLGGANAISLQRAINELKAVLPRRAVLVGQDPQGDVDWMQLVKGVDFKDLVDLSEVFTNSQGMVFSLRHEARVLLGEQPSGDGVHDPCWDAKVSVQLYRKASEASDKELAAQRAKLTDKKFWPPLPSMAKQCGYQIDGVCLSMYGADHCICGKPTITPKIRKR